MVKTEVGVSILVIYIAVHLIIRCSLKLWVSPNWLCPRGSSMQIHHPGSSSPMSDEVVLSRGHLDVTCFLQEELFGVPGLVDR